VTPIAVSGMATKSDTIASASLFSSPDVSRFTGCFGLPVSAMRFSIRSTN